MWNILSLLDRILVLLLKQNITWIGEFSVDLNTDSSVTDLITNTEDIDAAVRVWAVAWRVLDLGNGAETLGHLYACSGWAIGILTKFTKVAISEVRLLDVTVLLSGVVANSVVKFGWVLVSIEFLTFKPHCDDTITSEG